MVKIEIYEDGKPMPTETLEELDMKVVIIKKEDQLIIKIPQNFPESKKEEMMASFKRFRDNKAKFLIMPHNFKITVFRKEEE